MDDLMWCARISASRRICVSPLSSATVEENNSQNLGGDKGYFIYEVDEGRNAGGIQILGKAATEDAARRLVEIFLAARTV